MIQKLGSLHGAEILSIKSTTCDDVTEGGQIGEHNAFRLEIVTTNGILIYEGCHDYEPDLMVISNV